ELACEQVEGADAAVGDAVDAVADLIVDVAGGEHRRGATAEVGGVEATLKPALAVAEPLVYRWVHSKALASGVNGDAVYSPYTAELPRVFEFSRFSGTPTAARSAYSRPSAVSAVPSAIRTCSLSPMPCVASR